MKFEIKKTKATKIVKVLIEIVEYFIFVIFFEKNLVKKGVKKKAKIPVIKIVINIKIIIGVERIPIISLTATAAPVLVLAIK